MLARQLRCPMCGEPPKDVAPEVEINPRSALAWTCLNGHRMISGWRASELFENGWTFTHLPLTDE